MATVAAFCGNVEASVLGAAMRDSTWAFAAVESAHLCALALLGGVLLLLELGRIGVAVVPQPREAVERQLRPWLRLALSVTVLSGMLLFCGEAVKLCDSGPFRLKITALLLALAFHLLRGRPARALAGSGGRATTLGGVVSLALWLTVVLAARWIGFS